MCANIPRHERDIVKSEIGEVPIQYDQVCKLEKGESRRMRKRSYVSKNNPKKLRETRFSKKLRETQFSSILVPGEVLFATV
jgi:hypothetical protein